MSNTPPNQDNVQNDAPPPSSTNPVNNDQTTAETSAPPIPPIRDPIQVTVNVPPNDDKNDTRANNIARAGLYVNMVLGIFTILLFLQTLVANQTSKGALWIAERTLKDSREKDSLGSIRERHIDSLDSIVRVFNLVKDSTMTNTAQKTLQAQIQSVNTVENQFRQSNQPFLQVAQFSFDSIRFGTDVKIRFTIGNVGPTPAKLIEEQVAAAFFPTLPDFEDFQRKFKTRVANPEVPRQVYVTKDNYFEKWISLKDKLTPDIAAKFNLGVLRLYVLGAAKYKNLVTGSLRMYWYLVRISRLNNGAFYEEYFVNENEVY